MTVRKKNGAANLHKNDFIIFDSIIGLLVSNIFVTEVSRRPFTGYIHLFHQNIYTK